MHSAMVRPSLQSAPESPTLYPPPVSKHDARLLWRFLTTGDPDLSSSQLKIGTPLTRPLRNVYNNFDFSTFFCFRVTRTDGQTDRQPDRRTDGQDAQCGLQDGRIKT